jgi:glycosyltransferase involved in cell wall biosynthesis
MANPPTKTSTIELSVVIPVYRAEACLRHLHERLTAVLNDLCVSYELLLIDDRSPDDSWAVLVSLAQLDSHVRAIRLSRNFGQHAAITAGLAECEGRFAIVMDCDLEDPPEVISSLYQKALQGNDVVLARRRANHHAVIRKITSRLYFQLLNQITTRPVNGYYGCFSLISRKVIDAFLTVKATNRHYLLIVLWLGFTTTSIDYEQEERYSGTSSYSLGTLIRHGMAGLFFQTTTLLQWIIYIGFTFSGLSVVMAITIIVRYFLYSALSGWTSLSVLILGMGGMLMVSLGVIGLYIGQIMEQVKGQPLYLIDTQTQHTLAPQQEKVSAQ